MDLIDACHQISPIPFWGQTIFFTGILLFKHFLTICILTLYFFFSTVKGSKNRKSGRIQMIRHSNADSVCMTTNARLRYHFQNTDSNMQTRSTTKSRVSKFLTNSLMPNLMKCKNYYIYFIFLLKIIDILSEFCARSTIHGVKHFVDQKRHWLER